MPGKPTVSIVVVTYNAAEYVWKCLRSIHRHTPPGYYELIVVDNASQEPTKKVLRAAGISKLIENRENRLWAPACNQGAAASNPACRYILFLNSDVEILSKRWLNPALSAMDSDPKIGLAGTQWICQSPDQLRWPITGYLDGHFLLIRKTVWDACGPLDERWPWWHSEAVLALKTHLAGHISAYVPELKRHYIHYRGRSVKEAGKGEPHTSAFSFLEILREFGLSPRTEEPWAKPFLRRFFALPEELPAIRLHWRAMGVIPNGLAIPFHPIPGWMQLGTGHLGRILFYMAGKKFVTTGKTVSLEEGADELVLVASPMMRKGSRPWQLPIARRLVRRWLWERRRRIEAILSRRLEIPLLWAPPYSFESSRNFTDDPAETPVPAPEEEFPSAS